MKLLGSKLETVHLRSRDRKHQNMTLSQSRPPETQERQETYTVMVCSIREASSHESIHEQEKNGAKKREQEQSRFETVAAE